jgi:HEAT repeat protein
VRILSYLVALAALTPALRGQVPEPKKQKKNDEPQFDRSAEKKKPDAVATTPAQALDLSLPLITTWPAESGEQALQALIARGPTDLVPLLRTKLASGTVLERAAAARGLCLLADKESFAAIEKLFADPRQRRRFTALLASLHDLDPEKATALAMEFLDSEQGPLRIAAATLLKQNFTPQVRDQLEQRLVETRSDAVRLDLFLLLDAVKDPALPSIALERFLGDSNPQLAARVTTRLAWEDSPEIRAELLRLARTNRERKGMHAALALALAEQRTGAPLLPEELFGVMLPSIRTSDQLLRATACVVCGMIGYRSESCAEATQDQVLPALSDIVVRGRFFGDFELCFKAAVRTLELLTGEKLGESVPAWRDYFAAHADAPLKGHRELKGFVLEEDGPASLVSLSKSDAAGRFELQFGLVGPSGRLAVASGEKPGQIALDDATMRRLLAALDEAGLFAADLPRTLATPRAGALELKVEARGRERTIALLPDEPRRAAFEQALEQAAASQWWQVLVPAGDRYAAVYAEEQAWHETHPEAAAQQSRLVDLALAQIAAGAGRSADRAFDVLMRVRALGESVRTDQIDAMAALFSKLPPGDARTRELFDLLVSTKRTDALDRIVDALGPRGGAAVPWLADALVAFGRVPEGATDARPLVRMAALTAVERGSVQSLPEETLIQLATQDRDEPVRSKALLLLAKSDSELATKTLLELASEGDARAPALRALGAIRRDEALTALTAAARGSDGTLAAAAIEGLSRRGDEPAAAALEAIVRERGPSDSYGRLSMIAIKGLPRPIAIGRLRHLQAEGDEKLAHEAAYGLADLGEMQAVPTLLGDLEDAKLHRRAQTLLTYLFCKDLGTETWRFRSLYESQPAATHADHFLAALKESGTLVGEEVDLADRDSTALLVKAIEDPRWYVRRSALEFLEALTGRTLGPLAVDASKDDITAFAQRWHEATTTQARGEEQR